MEVVVHDTVADNGLIAGSVELGRDEDGTDTVTVTVLGRDGTGRWSATSVCRGGTDGFGEPSVVDGATAFAGRVFEGPGVESPRELLFLRETLKAAELAVAEGRDLGQDRFVYRVAHSRDCERALSYLRHGLADVDAADRHERTALVAAVTHSRPVAVQRLVREFGASLAASPGTFAGRPPMVAAAINENPEMVRILAALGADPDVRDHAGSAPLHYAGDSLPTVRALLDAGADPNATDRDGETPVFDAKRVPVLKALVEAGADIGYAIPLKNGRSGDTVLHRFAKTGRANLALAAVSLGADPKAASAAPLGWMAQPVGQRLAGMRGDTPILRAERTGHAALGEALRSQGRDGVRRDPARSAGIRI
ncbi:hypothetical protein TSO5_15795 [Azospirillum sp. TSO5]|nr:hypothetical protein TSO5_15795 [Azospirillum sp. TSO5]